MQVNKILLTRDRPDQFITFHKKSSDCQKGTFERKKKHTHTCTQTNKMEDIIVSKPPHPANRPGYVVFCIVYIFIYDHTTTLTVSLQCLPLKTQIFSI